MARLTRVERGKDWRRISLENPSRGNALCPALVSELRAALAEAAAACAKLVIFEGQGRHFCTGFDLSDADQSDDSKLAARFSDVEHLLADVWDAPFLTIAVAHGRTMGAGADLFVACDHRLAFEDARFAFPGSAFGIVLGTRRLGLRVGSDVAVDLALSGRTVDAGEASRLQLVTVLVTDEKEGREYQSAQMAVVERHASETIAAIKRTARSGYARTTTDDLEVLMNSAKTPGLQYRVAEYVEFIRAGRQKRRTGTGR